MPHFFSRPLDMSQVVHTTNASLWDEWNNATLV